MIHGIIFDLDGVLIDSEPVNIKAGQLTFAEFGYTLSAADLRHIPGRHSADYAPVIIRNNQLALVPEQIAARCHALFQELWEEMVVLLPAAHSTLLQLMERNLSLALATSSSRSIVDLFIQKFKFDNIFTATVTADDVHARKPDPEPYVKATARLKLSPEKLLVIEDTAVGIAAAKAAGLQCAVIPNKHSPDQNVSKADHSLVSLGEIQHLIDRLNQ